MILMNANCVESQMSELSHRAVSPTWSLNDPTSRYESGSEGLVVRAYRGTRRFCRDQQTMESRRRAVQRLERLLVACRQAARGGLRS